MSTLYRFKLFLFIPALFFGNINPVQAGDTYQYSLAGQWVNYDRDNADSDSYSLTNTIYFSEIDLKDKPIGESFFLARTGAVRLAGRIGESEGVSGSVNYSADNLSWGATIIYTRPDFPLLLEAGYRNYDIDYDPPLSYEVSIDSYSARAGYYIADTLLAGITYAQEELEYSINVNDQSDKTFGIFGKYVGLLSGSRAYNLELAYNISEDETGTAIDDNWNLDFSGDYYLNRFIGFGAGAAIKRGDSQRYEGDEYTVRNTTFFNTMFGIQLSYTKFEAENSAGEDSDLYQAGIIGLF